MFFLGRIIVILFALILAIMAAGMTFAFGLLGPGWHAFTGDPVEQGSFWVFTFFGATLTGAVALLPATIMIVLGETFKIRSLLAHLAAGAAVLLIAYYGSGLARPSYEESIDEPPPLVARETELAAAAGAVFGLVYWVIAGRNAGRWRERRGPSA
jgi:hypothetical protein